MQIIPLLPIIVAISLLATIAGAESGPWVRPQTEKAPPVWGFHDGIVLALAPVSLFGRGGGPRGLLRIGRNEAGKTRMVNYIAVEPVVDGKDRGFSELEHGADGEYGLRFTVDKKPWEIPALAAQPDCPRTEKDAALGWTSGSKMHVLLDVERFGNGAHPRILVSFDRAKPDEIAFTLYSAGDSAAMSQCALTATMGNFARLRRLWLKERTASVDEVFPGFTGTDFTGDGIFAAKELFREPSGDYLIAATTDEKEPAKADYTGVAWWWQWTGSPLTQYWKRPTSPALANLHARVNARHCFWLSSDAIPGGTAFENFEFRENYFEGQRFIYGITSKSPSALGFRPARSK